MQEVVSARTPAHLWIVGIVALLWNGFGAFDYVMTQTRNDAYLSAFSEAERAYFTSFPAWMEAFWALGVWGAVLGSVLLLVRSRHAVTAFAVSLVGAVVGLIYQLALSDAPASLSEGALAVIPWVIIAIAVALLLYARAMQSKGVLR